jgi:two-component system CheB/CheR fusion protein
MTGKKKAVRKQKSQRLPAEPVESPPFLEEATPAESEALQGSKPSNDFPIVGIGASAGGLEALEAFMKNIPEKCGMAFIVVQHLDPTHKGMMVELLQRATRMPISQVRDRMTVEPDCVYMIPPNKDLSILHGVLHLLEPTAPRGLRLPIDFFFRSLADDQQGRSIGVIHEGKSRSGLRPGARLCQIRRYA